MKKEKIKKCIEFVIMVAIMELIFFKLKVDSEFSIVGSILTSIVVFYIVEVFFEKKNKNSEK